MTVGQNTRIAALIVALLGCAIPSRAQTNAAPQATWLIAVSQPWTPPARVAVFASPEQIAESTPTIRRATITLVYETPPGGARSTAMVIQQDCAHNSTNLVSFTHYADDGSQLTTSNADSHEFSQNAPSAIGTRIGRALCADSHEWGSAIPAQSVPLGQTAVTFARSLFSSQLTTLAALTTPDGPVPAQADSLAPARSGETACYWPNLNARQCRIMEHYDFQANDAVVVHSTVAQSRSPNVVMSISYQGHLRDNAICGGPEENDARSATFQIDGRPASGTETRRLRDQFIQRLPVIASEGEQCVRFSQISANVVAQVTLRGVYNPVLDAPVIWIARDSGFSAGL